MLRITRNDQSKREAKNTQEYLGTVYGIQDSLYQSSQDMTEYCCNKINRYQQSIAGWQQKKYN